MTAAAPVFCSHCRLPVRGQGHAREVHGELHRFCCYGCCLAFQVAHGEGEESEAAWLLVRLGTGAFLSMNVMMFSLLIYSGTFEGEDAALRPLVDLLLWALATPCMLVLGGPLFREAWAGLARGRANAATLIALGAGTAYLYSTLAVLSGAEHLYFDTATMLLLLYTVGRYLEALGRARAMRNLTPILAVGRERVTVLEAARETSREAREVPIGALVLVRPGEQVGVDGIVVEGSSLVDEAIITGESHPVAKRRNDAVLAGSLNHTGALVIRTTGAGNATRWAAIARAVQEALAQEGGAQRLADRVAGALVPAVLVLAALTVLVWARWVPIEQALLTGLAVLVVACPCGLGLAGALATSLGIGRLARHGCVVRGGPILEALAGTRVAALDKTGTVTFDPRGFAGIVTDGTAEDEILRVAAALERASEHPLGRAIVTAAAARGISPPPADEATTAPGKGVRGEVGGLRAVAGSARWLAELGTPVPAPLAARLPALDAGGASVVQIAWDGRVRGAVALGATLRPEAADVVGALRGLGLTTVLLAGDRAEAATRVATVLGVDACAAELSPEAKVAALADWRARHGPVAMVGDGLNDGPVLAAADVGVAVGSATDLARESAGVVLPEGGLALLPWVIRLSRAVRRTILTNLLWAFGYNAAGLALAATGQLRPLLAAVLMAGSSLLVVANSLRLERFAEPSPDALSSHDRRPRKRHRQDVHDLANLSQTPA